MAELIMPRQAGRLVPLEALRGFAALYVVAHHVTSAIEAPLLIGLLFSFGQEAVALFFLISGIVIQDCYRGDPAAFAASRIRRIYPVFLAALAVAYAAVSVREGAPAPIDPQVLIGNLLMLQGSGLAVESYMGNAPLWSLAYEVFFYLAFVICRLTPRPHLCALGASAAGFAVLLAAGGDAYRPLAYLMIFWLGVGLAQAMRGEWRPVLAAGGLVALAAVGLGGLAVAWGVTAPGEYPLIHFRHFAAGLIGAVGLVVWSKAGWRGLGLLAPFAALAPISYALYAVHFPLVHIAPGPLAVTIGAVASLPLAWLIERQALRLKSFGAVPKITRPVSAAALAKAERERPLAVTS